MIRLAEEKDIKEINKLLEQVLYIHYLGRPDIFKEKGTKYTNDELLKIINNPLTPIFVYTDNDDHVLGHAFCIINHNPERPNMHEYTNLYIDDLCVEKYSRGMHVGTSLYNYIKEYAKANKIYNITLHVWENNENAKAFYHSLGLKIQQYTLEEIINHEK